MKKTQEIKKVSSIEGNLMNGYYSQFVYERERIPANASVKERTIHYKKQRETYNEDTWFKDWRKARGLKHDPILANLLEAKVHENAGSEKEFIILASEYYDILSLSGATDSTLLMKAIEGKLERINNSTYYINLFDGLDLDIEVQVYTKEEEHQITVTEIDFQTSIDLDKRCTEALYLKLWRELS